MAIFFETHIKTKNSFLRVEMLSRPGLVGGLWDIDR